MRQPTSLDAQFLALETRRQTGHVGSVAILDPSTTPAICAGAVRRWLVAHDELPGEPLVAQIPISVLLMPQAAARPRRKAAPA